MRVALSVFRTPFCCCLFVSSVLVGTGAAASQPAGAGRQEGALHDASRAADRGREAAVSGADEKTASVAGTVTDPHGQPVPDAQVIVTRAASVAAQTSTDDSGRYHIDVPSGRYEIRVAIQGFSVEPQHVVLDGGDRREVNLRLRLSAISESIVVSASQVEVPLSRVADSATVVSGSDIEARQFDSVADALRLVPGIDIVRSGGRGSVTSLFPRGGESDYTLVLVDGVRVNTFGGGFDFSNLPSSNVKRVEVVRGPGSALFGSDAMGAVVQIVTGQGGHPQAGGTLEGGSMATTRMTAWSSGSAGRWTWGGSVERVASAGFTGIAPATGERVSNDDYRSRQATGSATWRSARGFEATLNGAWSWSDRGYPGPFGSNPVGAYTSVDRHSRGTGETRRAGASLTAPLDGGRVVQHAQVAWFDFSSDFTSLYGLSASGTRRLAARSQTDVTIGDSTKVVAGVDLQHERARSDFITGDTTAPVPIVRNLVGLFVEARHQHGSRLTITGGLRAEEVRRAALEGSLNPYSPRPAFPADNARALNPKGSIAYLAWARTDGPSTERSLSPSWLRLRGSAGTGMRAPDGLEIAFTDNPHLKPERSRSAEAGIEAGFASGRAVLQATWFSNHYEDLIVAVGPAMRDASRYQTDNIANARSKGVEMAVSARTSWGLDARLAYTWLDTSVLAVDGAGGQAPAPFNVGDALLRRPRHQGSLDITFTRGRLTAYSELGARSRVLDVEPSWGAFGGLFWNPGYATVRCGASWRLLPAIDLVARADNLFDRRYEETFGFPAPGRTFTAGVRVAAGR
jgi:outer membrane cobalamin receptor